MTMEREYLHLCDLILDDGNLKGDRTGTGTRSLFGMQIRGDLTDGFPLLTTKKMYWKGIVHELLWFISGSTNIKYLQDNGVRIWDEWADAKGNLGPVYGHQWRNFGATKPKYTPIGKPGEPNDYNSIDYEDNGVDQLANVIERIKTNPDCRRLIVTGWNPQEINDVKLPPCHTLFQFYVFNGKLSCQLYQRSADFFLGVPFNIASYALLTHLVAHVTGLKVGEFVHTFGDAHIYNNHIEQMQEQISRELLPMPKLLLSPGITCIDDFKFGDIVLEGYESHPAIKGEVSV